MLGDTDLFLSPHSMALSLSDELAKLKRNDLLEICKDRLVLSRIDRETKTNLIAAIVSKGSAALHIIAREKVAKMEELRNGATQSTNQDRKRKREEAQQHRRLGRRVEEGIIGWQELPDMDKFMELPTSETVKECYRAFYNATSASAVQMTVCGVCGQEVGILEDKVTSIPLQDLPNAHRLVPKVQHPHHDLFNGCLLDPAGVQTNGTSTVVQICRKCFLDLKKTDCKLPPKFSLANGLWLGTIPWVLQVLTFPEQLLLSQLFPRVYVFKLFPKAGGHGDGTTLQRGMRGTVSTFELDTGGITSMISGDLLPHPPAVLASVISVTFIGLGSLPKRWLKSTFTVRRKVVHDALCWLKENNPYYAKISIDSQRLQTLPEDDVPVEILSIVHESDDAGIVEQENSGYASRHDDDSESPVFQQGFNEENQGDIIPESNHDYAGNTMQDLQNDTDPDVIPLEVSGVVDTDLSKLSANELMLWGLANLWEEGKEGGYAVRHGRKPVRDFRSSTRDHTGEMTRLLKKEDFRARVVAYIRANICAYRPGLESEESVKAIPKDRNIAYSCPPNPDAPNYDELLADFELHLARTEQVHTCRLRRCLVPDRYGALHCKRRAPFEHISEDFVDEHGNWGQKRLYEFMNAWMPGILINGRCNNDAKLLTNGQDTRDVTFYTLKYAAKAQKRLHNLSAILADGYAYHKDQLSQGTGSAYIEGLRDEQRLLIFRLVHAINREQELAAPMVMSYLMGWGDTYRSHHYTPIYWSSFVGRLFKTFPEFQIPVQRSTVSKDQTENPNPNPEDSQLPEQIENREAEAAENGDDILTLDINTAGKVYAKCQLTDYATRGEALTDWNIIEFFVNTYEEDIRTKTSDTTAGNQEEDTSASRPVDTEEGSYDDGSRGPRVRRGRQPNQRVPYLDAHPKHKQVQRVIRSEGHNNLPNFVGQFFPRRDDPENMPFYSACMLMLLRPWRKLQLDLKGPDETWEDALRAFLETPDARSKGLHNIVENIQYFHDCETSATENHRDTSETEGRTQEFDIEEEPVDEAPAPSLTSASITQAHVDEAIESQTPRNELNHARHAITVAQHARIFQADGKATWDVQASEASSKVTNANGDDLSRLQRWRSQLEADVAKQNINSQPSSSETPSSSGSVSHLSMENNPRNEPTVSIIPEATHLGPEVALTAVDPSELRKDQRRAYDIIAWHLDQTLAGRNPPVLRMIMQGEGGTGKSKVIQTLTETFAARGVSHMLVKAAYTGIAASLIGGKTTHVIGGISLGASKSKGLTDEAKARLEAIWDQHEYIIIDEAWMLAKSFLALLSRNISIAKQGRTRNGSSSFGSINVILVGDPHQFPPVACASREALYFRPDPANDSIDCQLGRKIYEEFTTVVTLKQQMRVTDEVWQDFLQHLRHGKVQERHLTILRELVVDKDSTNRVDFDTEPWKSAALVTPRHAVRKSWNEMAVRKMCRETGRQLFICTAEDTVKDRPLTLLEKYILESRHTKQKGQRGRQQTKDLPRKIELAIGMKVMVTNNIETDLDLTNGARGEIVDIVLHPDEPPVGDSPIVHLKYVPAYILVKLSRTRASKLEGLDDAVIPVEPITTTYRIKMKVRGKEITRTIRRRQFPMTAAYSFTDYRAQGQTLRYVIIDISPPPTGKLTLFNFPELFMQSHDVELLLEDARLEELNKATMNWYEEVVRQTRD
ncbi:hypothetical protein NLJ89_g3948 [Agrocybe chaxingu]|uniref:ATP-dependent DNA helicase n=1 Tax=Agrocybe chaxingu TaxID=84603 RepID=A0A9W8K1H2_9AGAR|nr:hypothetical protein NLJ89_g3948 [Agrocybe chaxingu]